MYFIVFIQIKSLVKFCKALYGFFGSGSHHALYAMFKKYSMYFNEGKFVGFLRAADTRMAGHFLCMQRALRLKPVLQYLVNSKEFLEQKKAKHMANLIKQDWVWNCMYVVVRSVIPALKLLRLADSNQPHSDKVKYYIRKSNECLLRSKADLDDPKLLKQGAIGDNGQYRSDTIDHYIMCDKNKTGRPKRDTKDEDDSESDSDDEEEEVDLGEDEIEYDDREEQSWVPGYIID